MAPSGPHGSALSAGAPGELQPVVYAGDAAAIAARVRARFAAYAPELRPGRPEDPPATLAELFGGMAERVASLVRELPEKARVEALRVAGLEPLPATPAQAMLAFDVAASAPDAVVVPAGFRVGARPASGGDLVVFETEDAVIAAPGRLALVGAVRGSAVRDVTKLNDDPLASFEPLGGDPRPGSYLLLGMDGEAAPVERLSLGIGISRPLGPPTPASEGGAARPPGPAVVLAWETFDGAAWVRAELVSDGTAQLGRSGIVEVRPPVPFPPSRPRVAGPGKAMRWLRLRLVSGRPALPPALDFVRLNAVMAVAARTLRDEVLEPVPGTADRRWRLASRPVVPGSLRLEVDGGDGFERWREVEDLDAEEPDTPAYALEVATGEVSFGDGVHGRALPSGFRNVRAASYRVTSGTGGPIATGAVKALLGSVPFVERVANPRPASGGDGPEPEAATLRRGPELLRARGRAVLTADYEQLALRTPGARVRRVKALAARHAAAPGRPAPGVVTVLVVPPEEEGAAGPPMPDEGTLRAVARELSARVAPAGVEIVAAAPAYHVVRVEAQVVVDDAADAGAAVTAVMDALRSYLHPLRGGDDRQGWPFGATLRHDALVRRVLSVAGVRAVPRLAFVVDGRRVGRCRDQALEAGDLLWPGALLVFPVKGAP